MLRTPAVAWPTLTVRVLVTLPLAGGVTGDGLNPQPTPAGRMPLQLRLTGDAKPLREVMVQVLVALLWLSMVRLLGAQAMVNPGGGGGTTRLSTQMGLVKARRSMQRPLVWAM